MRRFISFLLSLVILLGIGLLIFNFRWTTQTLSACYFYVRGLDSLHNAAYRDARQYFHSAIEAKATKQQAILQIAYSYAIEKDYTRAMDYYWLAIELDPSDYVSRLSSARTLWSLGWHKEAMAQYDALRRDFPEDKPLLLEIGDKAYMLAIRHGSHASKPWLRIAEEHYERGLSPGQLSPLRPWLRYAELAQKQHHSDKAFSLYCQILQHPNAPPEAIYSFAATLQEMEHPAHAYQWMAIAAEEQSAIHPDLASQWAKQALAIQRLGKAQHQDKAHSITGEETLSAEQKGCLDSLLKNGRFENKKP